MFATAAAHAQVVLVPPTPQIGSSNPITAEPPVSRPHARPCVVQLFQNLQFADFNTKSFSYAPPGDCPGPWEKVVFTADFNRRTVELVAGGDRPEPTPLQRAMERAAYRQRVLEELQSAHPLARDEQIAIWCQIDTPRLPKLTPRQRTREKNLNKISGRGDRI